MGHQAGPRPRTSRYTGIHLENANQRYSRWVATYDGKRIGSFKTELDALAARIAVVPQDNKRTSIYCWVYFDSRSKKWIGSYKKTHIGSFDHEEKAFLATRAYVLAAQRAERQAERAERGE